MNSLLAPPIEIQSLGKVISHTSELLSGISGISVAVFGSTALRGSLAQGSDMDIWLESTAEIEDIVETTLMESNINLDNKLHLVKASEVERIPSLNAAIRYRVATEGIVIKGILPDYSVGLKEEEIRCGFSQGAHVLALELADKAYVITETDAWTDGSITKAALRAWLQSTRMLQGDWQTVKRMDIEQLVEELAITDSNLAQLIKDGGWVDRVVVTNLRNSIAKTLY